MSVLLRQEAVMRQFRQQRETWDENVELVKTALEAWNAGDMDAFGESFDPDVIMRAPEGWPEPGPFVGRDAVSRRAQESA